MTKLVAFTHHFAAFTNPLDHFLIENQFFTIRATEEEAMQA